MNSIEFANQMFASSHLGPIVLAYLDPGAGSMMLQILLASALSSAFFMKTWIRQVRDGLLVRNKKV
jgi:hypothetical protein